MFNHELEAAMEPCSRLYPNHIWSSGGLMRSVRFSEGIVPVSDFKAQAADWLKRIAKTGQPLVITQNGKAAGGRRARSTR
jgi:hypothetical protein